ncbi:hypothetical protein RN38_17365 [Hafnia paralvei]|jgi:hypothetical protein|nr:hypothetical protein RN38_17365 [Hafnia paralvei]
MNIWQGISKKAPTNKQKNQLGNAAPNTGITGDNEQPDAKSGDNNSAGRISFIKQFKGCYLSIYSVFESKFNELILSPLHICSFIVTIGNIFMLL